jgi:hypothetical protein
MADTNTGNLGILQIETGTRSGSWGTTTNDNFDVIDQAIAGLGTVTLPATGSTGARAATSLSMSLTVAIWVQRLT